MTGFVCLNSVFFASREVWQILYVNWAKTKLNFRKNTEFATTGVDVTVHYTYIWPRNQKYNVESAPSATGSVFMLRFRLFFGTMQVYAKLSKIRQNKNLMTTFLYYLKLCNNTSKYETNSFVVWIYLIDELVSSGSSTTSLWRTFSYSRWVT